MKKHAHFLFWFLFVIIVSCTTNDPTPGADGLISLVKVSNENPGQNCASGGTKIDTGIDKNKNKTLDADEIQSTAYVCNGNNGLNNLIKITDEPAGANCTNGGYKIDAGLDLNRDGTLTTNEVTKTVYICNGNNGLNSLMNVSVEPAGANCANGGSKIDTGLDLNNDGTLAANEITKTVYICNGNNGLNNLLNVTAESAGTNCANGGYKIDTGIDISKDGILSSNEITNTSYICNGNNGLNSLINVTAEPAGTNCANGGYKIDSGLDVNKDGILNTNEITNTVFQCNASTGKYEIGMSYGGGIIFYLDETKEHGLIAAPNDQAALAWSSTDTFTNATGIAIGTGQSNTVAIASTLGAGSYAAKICDQLVLNGYDDWFLPSRDELNQLYLQKSKVGGFVSEFYWSSTERNDGAAAAAQSFSNGFINPDYSKSNLFKFRPIRSF